MLRNINFFCAYWWLSKLLFFCYYPSYLFVDQRMRCCCRHIYKNRWSRYFRVLESWNVHKNKHAYIVWPSKLYKYINESGSTKIQIITKPVSKISANYIHQSLVIVILCLMIIYWFMHFIIYIDKKLFSMSKCISLLCSV